MSRRCFVVVGAKGGCGATTIAFELAKRLPAHEGGVLVDGDLGGRRSHAVSFDVVAQLDANRLPGAPGTAKSGNLTLVELTSSYEDGFLVRADGIETAVAALPDATYIVDAPQPFAAAVRPFVARALRLIVIIEPTLLGASGARQLLATMARFGIPPARIVAVLNSRDGVKSLKRHDVQAVLQTPIVAAIPPSSDRAYARTLDSLAHDLFRLPHLESMPELRPSAGSPMGDRRAAGRSNNFAAGVAALAPLRDAAPDAHRVADDAVPAHLHAREKAKTALHVDLMSRIDFMAAARVHTDEAKMAELRAQVTEIAGELIAARRDLGSVEETAQIKQEIVEEAIGLGPIESLLHDPAVTEIMVNGARHVYVERNGRIERTAKRFVNDRQVRLVIERILAPLGRRIDESSPMVDARLPDGSRVNAIVEPLAIDGPTLTVRRFGSRRLTMDDLKRLGSLTEGVADFIRACVQARLNLVVSGGTGSGKTTLLNVSSAFIPRHERIITIEDAAELLLNQPHVVRLESRPPNLEGRGEVRIRELVRNALRMRPDRIVVGECRGAEALDMLQAMNTGHDGSLTTIHANSARDALARIETMVMMAGYDLPVRAIREQVSSAINIVVQVSRLRDGARRVTSVSEIVGMEGDIVTMQELIRFRQRGVDAQGMVVGSFESTGVQPNALRRFAEMGIDFDTSSLGGALPQVPAWSAR